MPLNVKKLASLSALGAGAAALTAANAEASIIYSGPFDAKVGIAPGYGTVYTSPALPGGGQFAFHLSSIASGIYHGISLYVKGLGGVNEPKFEHFHTSQSITALKVVAPGTRFSSAQPLFSVTLDARFWFGALAYLYGLNSFSHQYSMFVFQGCGAPKCYGWIELSLSVRNRPGLGQNGANGPNLDIFGYAYDDTGAKIPAGYTGPGSIPEPASLELAGFGALVLGAAGVRRWRAARKA